jgi:hypothetical protein
MKPKFTLLITVAICTAIASKAQISKGSIIVGGSLGLSTSTVKDDNGNKMSSNTTFSIAPSFGKAYKENRIFGINLNYSHTGDVDANSFGGGVFLRQYKSLSKNFYVFGDESLNISYGSYKYLGSNGTNPYVEKIKTTASYFSLAPGLAYDLTRKMQFEILLSNLLSLNYSNIKHDYDNNQIYTDYKENTFSLNSSLSLTQLSYINIGVRFILGRN